MPKIQWTDLPAALRNHLFERLRERKITADDLYQLKLWRESEPDAPEGSWYKDFGSFKICGQGSEDVSPSRPARKRQEAIVFKLLFSTATPTIAALHIVLALSERKFDDASSAGV